MISPWHHLQYNRICMSYTWHAYKYVGIIVVLVDEKVVVVVA